MERGNRLTRRVRRFGWVLAAFGALMGSAAAAPGSQGPVVVLRSSDLAPYLAVQSAFISDVGSAVRVLKVKDAPHDELESAIEQAGVVLAIGPEAQAAAANARPGHLLHALASGASGGIPLYASPERQVRDIRALLPSAQRLGVVYDPARSAGAMDAYAAAARSAGFQLVRKPVHARSEVAGAVRELAGEVNALWLVPDVTVVSADTFKFMIERSIENKIPVIGFSSGMAQAGALLVVEATYPEMGRKAAVAARRMLAGAQVTPQPADGVVYLNSSTADLLGVSIPSSLREQAAEVFQ